MTGRRTWASDEEREGYELDSIDTHAARLAVLEGISLPGHTAYTPTWTSTGTAPAIGDGTLVGRYAQVSGSAHVVAITLTAGATTTSGTGNYSFALPPGLQAVDVAGLHQSMAGYFLDASTANRYPMTADVRPAGTTILRAYLSTGSNLASGLPVTLAAGDFIVLSGLLLLEPV